jgi:carbamoyl-phosphate synthase large subunit
MNVLITSASAKIQLIQAFQAAVHPLGGTVVAADSDANCCAAHFADAFEPLPRDDDERYAERLLEACRAHAIGLLVPTRDGELQPVARLKPVLEAAGVAVPLPDAATLAQCQDKKHFQAYCKKSGFPVLELSDPTKAEAFPVFLRHRNGTFTGGGVMVENIAAFDRLGLRPEDYVVQQYVTDQEYSCDVLLDMDGKPLQAVARERQHLVNGESWRSEIVDMPVLTDLALALTASLGLRGHNLVQMFYSEEHGPRLIEVNARFGGCSNLSIKGGLASPERLVMMARGKLATAAEPRPIDFGLTSLRYASDVLVPPARQG